MKALCWIVSACCSLHAAAPSVKVLLRTGGHEKIVELPLERYVAATLAGESSVFESSEALKAMAVAARTYAVRMRARHRAQGFDLCDSAHCQRLDLKSVTPRLEAAAADTAGELLWFQGRPAFTPYTRDCGGRTEDAAAVWPDLAAPYLKSRDDPYCARLPSTAWPSPTWKWSADPRQIEMALRSSLLREPRRLDRISIASRTPSGRASRLLLAGAGESIPISASTFRFAMGRELGWNTVRGDKYEIRAASGRIVFEGTGAGHGVGLCQRGAEQMGLAKRSYREILAFYYPGTALGLTGQGLPWQKLTGETISLLTTQPGQDGALLAVAERLAQRLHERSGWGIPSGIEIRAYPDLDTFRNATGEPGWVAAHTEGRRIQLQPIALLRNRGALESTLTHELAHVLMDFPSRPQLPLWFREGLATYLEGRRTPAGDTAIPRETGASLRQTVDAAQAHRAYSDAYARVAGLVRTYGEGMVLDWVNRGLPPEVIDARTSQAAPSSK